MPPVRLQLPGPPCGVIGSPATGRRTTLAPQMTLHDPQARPRLVSYVTLPPFISAPVSFPAFTTPSLPPRPNPCITLLPRSHDAFETAYTLRPPSCVSPLSHTALGRPAGGPPAPQHWIEWLSMFQQHTATLSWRSRVARVEEGLSKSRQGSCAAVGLCSYCSSIRHSTVSTDWQKH